MPRRFVLALAFAWLALSACGRVEGQAADEPSRAASSETPRPAATFAFDPVTATPSPSPSPTRTPSPTPSPSPTRTPSPAPTRTPEPSITIPTQGAAFVVGEGVALRSAPSTSTGQILRRLGNLEEVQLLGAVKGERFVVGDQDWPMAYQSWTDTWYRVEGGFIYSAFVFVPRGGESSPFARGGARTIEVDIRTQTLRALIGGQVIFTAAVTTGKPGFDTPTGRFTVGSWGRVANETMTSGQAAITDPAEAYNVKNVLYTQYFDGEGNALHLNYWQPESVFGAARTSHGCVGLLIHDAQWLWFFAQGGVTLTIS